MRFRVDNGIAVCSRVVLGAGIGVTVTAAIVVPLLIVALRQRQRQKTVEAEASIVKDTFSQTLGIVCHELRNPVHALTGSLSALMDTPGIVSVPDAVEEVKLAISSVSTMQCVLDDVMEMQRHDSVCRCLPVQLLGCDGCTVGCLSFCTN